MECERLYEDIYRYGSYYNPARNHYNYNGHVMVNCDRCLKEDLSVCIGWNSHDLCLDCIADIDAFMNGEVEVVEEIEFDSDSSK